VPAGREQDHVVLVDGALAARRLARVQDVEELPREGLVGEVAAPAGRLRPLADPELLRQRHLPLARAAADVEEPAPVHQPLLLRDGGLEQQGRERPEQPALEPRLALDDAERVPALALGALPQHLAGEDEVRLLRLQDLLRPPHHEDAAVHAGVGVGAVAPARVDQHVEVVLARDVDVLDVDLEVGGGPQRLVLRDGPVGAAALAPLGLGDAEAGVEVHRLDLDALALHQRQRQRRVEPARDEADGLGRSRHAQRPPFRT